MRFYIYERVDLMKAMKQLYSIDQTDYNMQIALNQSRQARTIEYRPNIDIVNYIINWHLIATVALSIFRYNMLNRCKVLVYLPQYLHPNVFFILFIYLFKR